MLQQIGQGDSILVSNCVTCLIRPITRGGWMNCHVPKRSSPPVRVPHRSPVGKVQSHACIQQTRQNKSKRMPRWTLATRTPRRHVIDTWISYQIPFHWSADRYSSVDAVYEDSKRGFIMTLSPRVHRGERERVGTVRDRVRSVQG